mgnify:CR=1 FL=1
METYTINQLVEKYGLGIYVKQSNWKDLKIKVNIFNNNQYYTYSKNYGFKKFHSYSNRKAKTIFNQEQPIWQLTESY